MNILTPIIDFHIDNMYFKEMDNINNLEHVIEYRVGLFSTIGFTCEIEFQQSPQISSHYFNNVVIDFEDTELIARLRDIEEKILQKANITKQPIFKLYDGIRSGKIKIYLEKQKSIDIVTRVILRIQSIWENNENYGLYFKFFI